MRRIVSLIIIVIFLIWLFPLGVFIKPTDEKKVCGGQRAICLCKGKPGTPQKLAFSHPPSNEKETAPSGGSHHYLAASDHRNNSLISTKLIDYSSSLYSLTFCKSIEHVPKV